MSKAKLFAVLLVGILFSASLAHADAVNVGVLSFDTFIAGSPGAPGVNAVNITNLTGDPATGGFALPPGFPVLSSLTFLESTLTLLLSDGTTMVFVLGDLGPGAALDSIGDPLVQISETTTIASATFQATLDSTSFLLSDGSIFLALSPLISVTLLPSSGNTLVADSDFAVISVQPVPEPGSLVLIGSGLAGLWALKRKRTRP